MIDTFDIQDQIFELFLADSVLQGLLSIPDVTDMSTADSKIRRTAQDPTLLTADMLDFLDYSFVDARGTGNFLVNRGLLEFNVYSSNRYNVSQIYKAVKRILKANFEDMQVSSEGQVGCPVPNIICYRIRVRPMVGS